MRATRDHSRFSGFLWLRRQAAPIFALGLSGCTLITDVDREKIPQPQSPTFDEVDAGPQPTQPPPDAGPPDASLPPDQALDAGADAGLDAGDAGPDADAS